MSEPAPVMPVTFRLVPPATIVRVFKYTAYVPPTSEPITVMDLALIELLVANVTPQPVVVEVPVMFTAPLFATIGETPHAAADLLPAPMPVVVTPVMLILPLVAVRPAITEAPPPPPVLPPALIPLMVMAVPLMLPSTRMPEPLVVTRLAQFNNAVLR